MRIPHFDFTDFVHYLCCSGSKFGESQIRAKFAFRFIIDRYYSENSVML